MKFVPTIVVNSPLPNQEGSVLGPVSESRLGRIMDAAHLAKVQTLKTHKQQHAERLQAFITHRKDAAKRCREAVLGVHIPTPQAKCSELNVEPTRPSYWTRLADRTFTVDPYDRHVTGRYAKVYQHTYLTITDGHHVLTNWCPTCKEYVAQSHDGPKGMECQEYIKQRTQREAAHLARLRWNNLFEPGIPVFPSEGKKSQIKGKLTLAKRRREARMVAPINSLYLKIQSRLEEGQSPITIARELEVSRCRVLQLQKRLLIEARLKAGHSPSAIASDYGSLVVYGVFGITPEEYVQNLKDCLDKLSQAQKGEASIEADGQRKRHYVRHVVADLHFVRQQDVNLATNI